MVRRQGIETGNRELGVGRLADLPADGVAGNGGKACIPQPAKHIDRGFDAGMVGARVLGVGALLVCGHDAIPLLGDTDTDEQEITAAEGDVGFAGDGVDLIQRDLMLRESGVGDAVALRPRSIIDQDTATYRGKQTECEMISGISLLFSRTRFS
jgi:hypothetical protein